MKCHNFQVLVQNSRTDFFMDNSIIFNNTLYGLLMINANGQIDDTQFIKNENFNGNGIAIYTEDSSLILRDSLFSSNIGTTGVFLCVSSTCDVYRTTFEDNIVDTFGPSIRGFNANITISESTFRNLTSFTGGITAAYGNVEINNCLFQNNYALDEGASVHMVSANVLILNSSFSNDATGDSERGSSMIEYYTLI